jgi:multiple sugar transport system substrate-binding protein
MKSTDSTAPQTSPASQASATGPSRRGFLTATGAIGLGGLLAACGVGGGSDKGAAGSGKGSIRALFMKQAGYSEANIHAMTASFQKAHPGIKVNADFVS